MFIWLDMPWEICREGVNARGLRRGASETDHANLVRWAEDYWVRETSSSFKGHLALFEHYSGQKFRLRDRAEVSALLAKLREAALDSLHESRL